MMMMRRRRRRRRTGRNEVKSQHSVMGVVVVRLLDVMEDQQQRGMMRQQ
jgi:hypothetical protein